MIGYGYDGKMYGIEYIPPRRKPCLVVQKKGVRMKIASFDNAAKARVFLDFMADLYGMQKVDWMGDDIPVGLMTKEERDSVFERMMT